MVEEGLTMMMAVCSPRIFARQTRTGNRWVVLMLAEFRKADISQSELLLMGNLLVCVCVCVCASAAFA